jgi:hypothetical protein
MKVLKHHDHSIDIPENPQQSKRWKELYEKILDKHFRK